MSVDKQLLRYHINRLKNKSRDVRLKAIEELQHLSDDDALEPLREVFESDSDPDVRKAAREAGLAIYRQNRDSVV